MSIAHIRKLPEVIINRIAAGEVVERPASVVKELVENAIDAGATQIDVAIDNGGRNLISVSDNGHGIAKDDLELCAQRHVTSKLPDDDLFNIGSFGFRGEALPSIASVGKLTISSRLDQATEAWSYVIEGGHEKGLSPCMRKKGTLMEVRDLFYATPARLKFLKSERGEKQQVVDVINRIAMAYPEIGFSLKVDGKNSFSYLGENGDLFDQRLMRLSQIINKDFAENACPVEREAHDVKVEGYVSLPTYNRGTSQHQYIFVNNRPVKDKLILGAIKGAYQDFLPRGRFPVVVLFITVEPEDVDVNVHPAKAEVRFRDSQTVRSVLVGAIKHAVNDAGHQASTTVAQQALSSFSPQIMPSSSVSSASSAKFQGDYSTKPSYVPSGYNSGASEKKSSSYLAASTIGASAPSAANGLFAPVDVPPVNKQFLPGDSEFFVQHTEDVSHYPLGAAMCQLHKTYIVAQAQNSIVIVDQHAAHERLVYEEMKKHREAEGVKTQKLLMPEIVELEEAQYIAISTQLDALKDMGLVLEAFGKNALMVKETPAILGEVDATKLIRNIADDVVELGETLTLTEAIEHVVETMACHGSIRAGREMAIDEMNALLRQMEATPHSGQCNHGRPTYVELQLNDVEKLFGRS